MLTSVSALTRVLAFLLLSTFPLLAQAPVERYLLSDFSTGRVHILNVSDDTEMAQVLAGGSPAFMAVSPNGRIVFVSNINSDHISVIDLTLNPPVEVARIGGVHIRPMALNGDGTRLVGLSFADTGTNTLKVIDTSTLQVVNTWSLGINVDPRGLVVVGNTAYLQGNTGVPSPILAVDLNAGTATTVLTSGAAAPAGSSMAATPDGRYVVALRGASMFLISTSTNTVAATVAGNGRAVAIPATAGPDGSLAFVVVNAASGTRLVKVLDLRPTVGGVANAHFGVLSTYSATLPSSFNFTGFIKAAATSDGSRLYVETSNVNATTGVHNVAVVDTSNALASLSFLKDMPVGAIVQGLAVGFTQSQPPATAPQVTDVNSNETDKGVVVNSATANVSVSGAGFASDAKVRIGNLDEVSPGGLTATSLQAPIPALAAAQGADLIVTNFNSASPVSEQLQSGILRGALAISSAPTFQPANQVVVGNFGESTVSVLNVGTNASASPPINGALSPAGIGISPDAERAYLSSFSVPNMGVFNLVSGQTEADISLDYDPAVTIINSGSSRLPVIAHPAAGLPGGGDALLYVTTETNDNSTFAIGQRLHIVDVNPASPAFNTVLVHYDAATGKASEGALAATPDGSVAYLNSFDASTGTGTLTVFNLGGGGAITDLLPSSLGLAELQPDLQVTDDGAYLLAAGSDGTMRVLSLDGHPTNPTALASITPMPAGPGTPQFDSFRVAGGHVFAFDSARNVVEAFNFNPTAVPNGDFSWVGTAVIPATPNQQGAILSVAPDASLLYAGLHEDDAVAAISVPKLLVNAPDSVLTKLRSGLAPISLAVRPGTATPASTASQPIVTVQPLSTVTISLTDTSGGTTSVATTNTNTTPTAIPAGFQVGSIPIYYEISTTSTFSSAVVCFGYDPSLPADQVSALGVLHYNSSLGQWQDVTVPNSLDTVNHTICGQVSSFSPFVTGVRTTGFELDSLVGDISAMAAPKGIMQSLRAKALAARASFARHDKDSATGQLTALISQLKALSGTQVSTTDADRLIAEANSILGML